MANLLSWLGGAASRVGNTIHNDYVQPINRDVVQPINRVNNQITRVPQQVAQPVVNAVRNVPVIKPLMQADAATLNTARGFAGVLPNEAKAAIGLGTHNLPAANNAMIKANAGLNQARDLIRSVPRGAIGFVGSTAPGASKKVITPTGVAQKFLLGSSPINSVQTGIKQDRKAGVSLPDTITHAALTAAGDAGSFASIVGAPTKLIGDSAPLNDVGGAKAKDIIPNKLLADETKTIGTGQTAANDAKASAKGPKVNIPTTATVKAPSVKATLGSKVTAVRASGTTPGSVVPANELANHIQGILKDKQDFQANAKNATPGIMNLSKEEFNNLGNAVHNGAAPMNDKVAALVGPVHKTMAAIENSAKVKGVDVTHMENYFPGDYSAIKPGTPDFNARVQQMVNNGTAKDSADAIKQLNDAAAFSKGTGPASFGNFDKSRHIEPPSYTKEAYQKYLNGAATRISQASHFGPNGEVSDKLIGQITKNGGDGELANKAVQNYNAAPIGSDKLAGARAVYGAARLGKAPISHLGQAITNVPLETSLHDTLGGLARLLTKSGRDAVARSDVNNPENIHGLSTQETGVQGKMSKVTALGLGPVQRANRSVASSSGMFRADALAADGTPASITELRSRGVTGPIGKTLTTLQQDQVGRNVTNKTLFTPDRGSTPVSAETGTGKTIGQYRTAYGYKEAGFLYNKVIKEGLGKGNPVPLAKLLLVGAPITAATVFAKNAITPGSDNSKGSIASTTVQDLTGPGGSIIGSSKYAKSNLPKTAASDIAPLAGESVDVAQRANKAIGTSTAKPNPKSLESYVAGLIPLVGKAIGNKINPPPAPGPNLSSNAAPATTQTQRNTQTAAQLKQMRADPSVNVKGNTGITQLPNGHYSATVNGAVTEEKSLQNARSKVVEGTLSNNTSKSVNNVVYSKDSVGNATSSVKLNAVQAQTASDFTNFKTSAKNFGTSKDGNTVFAMDAAGNATQTPKTTYDYGLGTATLTSQKNADNLTAWLGTANSQMDLIQKQLNDPVINSDPAKVLKLQNDASTLQTEAAKYQSYGGFTKPTSSSASASSSRQVAGLKSTFATVDKKIAAPKGVKVSKVSSTGIKAPSLKKLSVSKIPSNYSKLKLGNKK